MRRLFWDIETAPNVGFFWHAGPKVNLGPQNIINERSIICICWKWEGQNKVYNAAWDGTRACDEQLVKDFAPVLEEADEMVGHNGDRFDLRWYQGRHLMHELPPIQQSKTVDTMKITKKHFFLNSYKLDYLANILLGYGKLPTGGFDLWKGCHPATTFDAKERAKNLRKMIRYCKRDVSITEELWKHIIPYEMAATHAAVDKTGNAMDRWKCAHCASDDVFTNKRRVTAAGMVKWSMQCNDCGRYYQIANAVHEWYKAAKGAGK